MTAISTDAIGEAARLWAIRVADPEFDDWDQFSAWLDADPAHLAAYDAAVADEEWATELFETPMPAPIPLSAQPAPSPRRWRWAAPGALAASVAVAAVGGWFALEQQGPTVYATSMGEHRTIALDDGSKVILNGGTEVVVADSGAREVQLVKGEALFEVRHDERRPFIVNAGGTRLVDLGTVFNVVRDKEALDVAVAEGAVLYQSSGHEVHLNPGDALARSDASSAPVLRRAAPDTIGTWRTGYLQYDDVSLETVAGDLSRNLGKPVRVDPGVADRRFTGTIMLQGSPDAVLERTGALVDVRFIRNSEGWTAMSGNGSRR